VKKVKVTEFQFTHILNEMRFDGKSTGLFQDEESNNLNEFGEKIKSYVKDKKSDMVDSWNTFTSIARREGKETAKAANIIGKLLSREKVSKEEKEFLKKQSGDIAKIVTVMSLGAVSMVIPIALEKILNRWNISIMPTEQEKTNDTDIIESNIEKKYHRKKSKNNKLVIEFTDTILNTLKDFNENRRINKFTNFEKQIYFYQKGFSRDERLLRYVNNFRKYYYHTHNQTTRNLTNEEIATFLTKHYYIDIKPHLNDPDIIFKDEESVKLLFPKYSLIWMSDLGSIDRDFNSPDIHSESIDKKEKILYSAVVLDEDSRDTLLALMRLCIDLPEDWKRLAHHMTIV